MSDEPITHEELRRTLTKAIARLADAAGDAASSVSRQSAARDYAEAAERLANALSVTSSVNARPRG
jgi:hypothetical protein